jgi:hypothetical protein
MVSISGITEQGLGGLFLAKDKASSKARALTPEDRADRVLALTACSACALLGAAVGAVLAYHIASLF